MHQDPAFDTSDLLTPARATDYMRADALRLALEIADTALSLAERVGGAQRTVAALRMQVTRLRAAV